MIKLVLLYDHPEDPAAFDAYYRETHTPLVDALPGLVRFEAAKVESMRDGSPSENVYLVAELAFRDHAALQAAFASDQGVAVREDVVNFAPRGNTGYVCEIWDDPR